MLQQLLRLRLPGMLVLPTLLRTLRDLVPADHGGFFFCDDAGSITNLYAERLLAPSEMAGYHERHDGERFRQQYLARVKAARSISRRSVDAAERASAYHREVLAPLGIEHFLYAIVRHQGRALGQLSLYRGPSQPAFGEADETALEGALHLLGPMLAQPQTPTLSQVQEQTIEEGLALLDGQARVLFADAHWPRLLRMAQGNTISPARAREDAQVLPQFVAGVLARLAAAPQQVHLVHTTWGQFAFRQHRMASPEGEQAVALWVSRMAAQPLRLVQGAAALQLSPQQREVAVCIARGLSNSEIAAELGVRPNTATYHVRQVFARLDVHERTEVARRLIAAAGPI